MQINFFDLKDILECKHLSLKHLLVFENPYEGLKFSHLISEAVFGMKTALNPKNNTTFTA